MTPQNHKILERVLQASLAAVRPENAVRRELRREGHFLVTASSRYDLWTFDAMVIVGAGKATSRMAAAVEEIAGDRLGGGLVVVKHGYTASLLKTRQVEAGHPVPDSSGVAATREIMEIIERADARTLILCLLSGGGSALLVAPAPGLTLGDKQRTTDLLLRAGASIDELNTVRKHLSAVKGGRLARAAHPATILTLILSDVIGDRLDVIASGPTAPDGSTFADAAAVIAKYGLTDALPAPASAYLKRGIKGQEPETVRAADPCFRRTQNIIVGSSRLALVAALKEAEHHELRTELLSAELQGEARDAGRLLAEQAVRVQRTLRPGERRCLLSGGETTVTVRGSGKGGRNQELALAFALAAAGSTGITLLSAGTDGSDGPTDAAGAIVDGTTAVRARTAGLEPQEFLDHNDSYEFFKRFDALTGGTSHLITGPTGTNVMDLQVLLVEAT